MTKDVLVKISGLQFSLSLRFSPFSLTAVFSVLELSFSSRFPAFCSSCGPHLFYFRIITIVHSFFSESNGYSSFLPTNVKKRHIIACAQKKPWCTHHGFKIAVFSKIMKLFKSNFSAFSFKFSFDIISCSFVSCFFKDLRSSIN